MNTLHYKPANILYVDPNLKIGGGVISLLDLMRTIDPRYYHPILVCPGKGPFSELCLENGIQVEYLPGIPINGGKPLDFARVLIPNTLAISKLIQNLDVHLVHSNSWRVAYYCGLAAHRNNIPAVAHVRDYNESYRAWPKYWLLGLVSDSIITVSNAVRESIHSHVPALDNKTKTIYTGLPTPIQYSFEQVQTLRHDFGIDNATPLLAVVGLFSPLKGQDIILRALPQILIQHPQTRLLLVGEPLGQAQKPYHDELLSIVHHDRLEKHVIFTGFRRDIPLIMASVDILVHPPTLPDAFPHVLLEGGAQKALVVASDIGGIGEIIQDGISGRLVPPGEPESLAQAIIQLLDHPEQGEKMRAALYKRVTEEFTIARHVSEVQKLYEKLLRGEY